MIQYSLTFLFSPEFELVWLMEKQKPNWQKGFLNGIGGKLNDQEAPIHGAIRELKEEAGITVKKKELTPIGEINGSDDAGQEYKVYVFAGTTTQVLKAQEDEPIDLFRVDEIKKHKLISNVPMIIETCIYRLSHKSGTGLLVTN